MYVFAFLVIIDQKPVPSIGPGIPKTKMYTMQLSTCVLLHTLYSPDMAPIDYFLCPKLEKFADDISTLCIFFLAESVNLSVKFKPR
jgi:hypothetical protein